MKRSLATALTVAMFGLAACGGDDGGGGGGESGNDYPAQAEENFMTACTSQPQATQEYCQCTFDEITATVPFEDFQEAEEQIGSGGLNDAPKETRDAFQAAVEKCRSEIQ